MIKLELIDKEQLKFVPDKYIAIGEYQHVYVLERENQVIVYISLFEYNNNFFSINYLKTKPEFTNQGYAKIALNMMLEMLEYSYVSLEVRKSNQAAINLYLKSGFTQNKIKPNYYTNPIEDGLEMIIEK
jgi:ribosomal-protein-alanine N-acetyltransferase